MKNMKSSMRSFATTKFQVKKRNILATQILWICAIALIAVIGLTMIACNKSGGNDGDGKSFNSAEKLKKYLDKQPANSPDKSIKISMSADELMLPKIADVLKSTNKYVSLNLSGNALTAIGWGDFASCTSLTNITIPNSVTIIWGFAFQNCTGLTSITIPDSVTSIGDHAFEKCTGLTSVTIPNSVTEIGECAFKECTSLTSVNIPNGVTEIEGWAFSDCTSLTSVIIPNSVTNIDNCAFLKCTSLTSVIIPNSVISIKGSAFGDCTGLTSITIPNSVIIIENRAFSGCTNLTSVTFQGANSLNSGSKFLGLHFPFEGDLIVKYYYGKIGTYTTTAPVDDYSEWTKQL